jgi:hypothetical protein
VRIVGCVGRELRGHRVPDVTEEQAGAISAALGSIRRWSNEAFVSSERLRRSRVLEGAAVVANARNGADECLVAYAKARGLAVWIDRRHGMVGLGGWGNPHLARATTPQGLPPALRGRYRGESRARAEDCRDAPRQGAPLQVLPELRSAHSYLQNYGSSHWSWLRRQQCLNF